MIALLSRILISYALWVSASEINHEFDPLPETSVCAFCRWQVQLNTDPMRIPSTITEVVCQNPNSACRGNTNYQCRQIHAKMVIAYTNPYLYKQNIDAAMADGIDNSEVIIVCLTEMYFKKVSISW